MKLKKIAAVFIAAAAVTLLCAAGTITIYSEDTDPNSHDHSGWTEWTSDDSLPDTAGNYYLTKDVTITRNDNYIEMPDGDLRLCLNGHDITVSHIIEVGNVGKNRESNVAIYDCQGECGTIMIDNDGLITETLFDVFYGSLTVYNGRLESKNGKAVHSSNDSAVTVEGGTITGMECGISINGGTVIINDGTVEGSKECDYSCGIECSSEDAQLIVNDGNISGAWQGIYVTAGTATINSGTIEGTDDYSDGIWCYGELGGAEVIVKGGTISGDSSGIYILGGTVKVEKGEISGTEGGIWCTQDSDVTALEITGGTISSTEYSIYSDDPDGTFMLSGNPTLTGDIYLNDGAKITVAGQLTNTDPYTIRMSQTGVFTDGDTTHNDPDKFKAAEIHSNDGYSVNKNADGQLELVRSHKHDDGVTFDPWTSTTSLPTTEGNYYLTDDVTLNTETQLKSGAVNLCLNGNTIKIEKTAVYIGVQTGGELNIYDCHDENCGGILTDVNTPVRITGDGGKITLYNGNIRTDSTSSYGININSSGTLTIEGGSIYGGTTGVYNYKGTVIMKGGTVEGRRGIWCLSSVEISGGQVKGDDFGVYISSSGDLTVSGDDTVIYGNQRGIYHGGQELTVSGGTITGDTLYGIEVHSSAQKTEIFNGTIKGGFSGIFIYSDVIISGDPEITGDTAGIYIFNYTTAPKLIINKKLSEDTLYSVYVAYNRPYTFTNSSNIDYNVSANFVPAPEHVYYGYEIIKNDDGQLRLALKTYTVTYNGGEYGEGTIAPTAKTHGKSVTLSSEKFTRTGYIQTGWATEDGGEKEYDLGGTYSGNADITLYPAWEECDHSFGNWTDCEDGENHTRTCGVCGAIETVNHSFGNWTDCEDGENHTLTCVCGASETEKHTFGDWTDNEDGETHARACVCGASETEDHIFGDWTDNEDGETHARTCSDCKAQETANHVESEEGETTKPATETEDGEMVYKCRDCGYVMSRETIPAAGSGTPETPVPGAPAPQPPAPGTSSSEVPSPETSVPETTAPEVSEPKITAPSAAEPAPDQDPNAGSVIINSNSGDNAPAVSIDAETADRLKKEVIAKHLTDEERAAVASGADLEIILSVEDAGDTVSAQDKQAAETVIADTAYTMGQYLNIDLLKLINGQQVGKITQLNAPISVTIEIPQELTAANRTFAIVRVHDGAAEILVDQDTDPDTITIITDRFSTYAIVYQDNTNAADKNQATGVVLVITPFIYAAAGVIISKKRK